MSFSFSDYDDKLLFVPLGGSNEIGMNLNLYRHKGRWLMVDLGIGFADDYLPGVDVVVPDISFIIEHKDALEGILVTHAHEDHLGAIPYLWEELKVPIYATPFTASILKAKLAEEGINGARAMIREVQPGSKFDLGPFGIELINLTHSIPEMQAVAIRTQNGTVLHTGDWKIDPEPMVGEVSDKARLSILGDEGVLAIICDSTNVFVEGSSGSEAGVREELAERIAACENRVVVTTFASNIARVESIVRAAQATGRKIVLAGRSLHRVIAAAQESGYLTDAPPFLTEKDAAGIPRDQLLILATGCQGEPMAALSRMARQEHPSMRLQAGDTVIFSAREIPGNESRIGYMHNKLVGQGIDIITAGHNDIHVSGHPARDELAEMYQMVRPQIAVPVHGEPRHIHEHAKLAKQFQVPETVEARNGAVILLEAGKAREIAMVNSGYIAVDGNTLLPTDSSVFRARRRMREEGIVMVTLVMEGDELIAAPAIMAPGCLDPEEDAELIEDISERIESAIGKLRRGASARDVTSKLRETVRKALKPAIGKRPLIEVQLIRV